MRRHKLSRVVLFALLCATALGASGQTSPAIQANADGNRAYNAGRFEEAAAKFQQALKLATDSGDGQYAAIAMYGLGRAHGKLCHVAVAEDWFRKSIAAREALPDDPYARLTQNLLELGRFLMAHGRTAEALPLLDRAVPMLEKLGIEKSDPIAYAVLLDDYAGALGNAGRSADASAASARGASLRKANAGRTARFKPESYPTDCKSAYAPDAATLASIARGIEGLKGGYAQLEEFSAARNMNPRELSISYAYRTRRAAPGPGWMAGVPNPQDDGVWFFIDFHDPASTRQIHTQPALFRPECLGGMRVGYLILEGRKTAPLSGAIADVLSRHGIAECR